jgi:iron complex outermembrane receptor protein
LNSVVGGVPASEFASPAAAWGRTSLLALLIAAQSYAQQPTEVVEVIGQTPLGANTDGDSVTGHVQGATSEDLAEQRALDLADFMKRNLASVFVNEAQSNPLQPDVQYRGFVGSPLLGLPQGIAVYQNGVRINEPFGDTVNWALIPDVAIANIYLMPGSNPLFGLNALGGAITIETKDGFSHPGTRAEAYTGSFDRIGASIETGGQSGNEFGYFFAASYLEEAGWREFSPTQAVQLFGNVAWQTANSSFGLDITLADTDLIGNGAAPIELLEIDRKSIFTRPDQTENDLALTSLIVVHEVSNALTLTGNLYLRSSDIRSLNGDESDFEECANTPGFVCEFDSIVEQLALDQNEDAIPFSSLVDGATTNRTLTKQDSIGTSLQAAWSGTLAGRENSFVVGFSYDQSDIAFDASTALGELDATRLAIPSRFLLASAFTRLETESENLGIFLTDTLRLTDSVALTLSGRFNDTNVVLRDQIGTELNGDHSFDRFNPAIGITFRASGAVTFYASYSESNRTPSPVELSCADETDPCRLPNAFLADPPLKQVVAETTEFGVRGDLNDGAWHAGVFRTTNKDDILFISAGALTNQGFFDNVGRTRREGLELSVDVRTSGNLSWFANYTYLEASFLQSLTFPSPNNPMAVNGEVSVSAGDQLPLIPDQLLKAGFRLAIGDSLSLGGELLAGGAFHMRGDEGNDSAKIGDFSVVNIRGDYLLSDKLRLFLNIDNIFDARYESFGLFGAPEEVLGDQFTDSRFVSPGAPRAAWFGVQVEF